MVKDSRFILQTGCSVIVCVTGGNSVYRGATAVTLSNFDDKIINSRYNSGSLFHGGIGKMCFIVNRIKWLQTE